MTARQITGLGVVALLLATLTPWLTAPAASAAVRPGDVELTIQDVRPNSPVLSNTPQPLAIAFTLTNTSDQTLKDVTVSAARSDPIGTEKDPIGSQRALDAVIARPVPRPPSDEQVAPLKTTVRATLAPHSTADLVYRTNYDIPQDADLCLCANAIYPIYLAADYTAADGTVTRLDTAQTYLPSFTKAPAKTKVGWVWPLLDRAHRLTSDTIFTDEALTTEVESGGRLDQLLQVVEQVAGKVPMTVVTDPELIDELLVMSGDRGYYVKTPQGTTVRGAGGAVAKAWLARFKHVLDSYPKLEVDFTAYADPAVESLSRNGLEWFRDPPAAAQARITAFFGGLTPLTDIVWPANGTLSPSTLTTLVNQGAKTVVLGDKVLPRPSVRGIVPDALASIQTPIGTATAAVTSTPIEHWLNVVLQPGGKGLAALPDLVAELAMRVVTSPAKSHYVLLAPPRNLTVDPEVARRTILATASSSWSTALPLRAATNSITALERARIHPQPAPNLSGSAVLSLLYVSQSLPGLGGPLGLYPPDPTVDVAAKTQLAALPIAVQRCESTSLLVQAPHDTTTTAARLERVIRLIRDGVHLAQRAGGTYTLASKKSKLPITVTNPSANDVQIKINITTTSGVPGFNAEPVNRTIRANSTVQVRIPTQVDRVGRIDVTVALSTPGGLSLGQPIPLTVRSTALGTIGVVITVAAAIVLALALLVRFTRRMMKRRRPAAPPAEPVSAGAAAP